MLGGFREVFHGAPKMAMRSFYECKSLPPRRLEKPGAPVTRELQESFFHG